MQQPERKRNDYFHVTFEVEILDQMFGRHNILKNFFYQIGMLLEKNFDLWPNIFTG